MAETCCLDVHAALSHELVQERSHERLSVFTNVTQQSRQCDDLQVAAGISLQLSSRRQHAQHMIHAVASGLTVHASSHDRVDLLHNLPGQ
nr:hypothetical protein [uncultured bacterium]